MRWPEKSERENFQILGFIEAYERLPEARHFEVVAKGENPDYIVRDKLSNEEYGVEVTAVYLDDRSVPDFHMREEERCSEIPYDKNELEKYKERLIDAITEKVCKARKGYDTSRPLILSIYVNEYISIYLGQEECEEILRSNEEVLDTMTPFAEVVFWNLVNNDVFCVRPS